MTHQEVEDLLAQAGLRMVEQIPLATLPVSERHSLLPISAVEPIERGLSRLSVLSGVAQHIIYVCARTS